MHKAINNGNIINPLICEMLFKLQEEIGWYQYCQSRKLNAGIMRHFLWNIIALLRFPSMKKISQKINESPIID